MRSVRTDRDRELAERRGGGYFVNVNTGWYGLSAMCELFSVWWIQSGMVFMTIWLSRWNLSASVLLLLL